MNRIPSLDGLRAVSIALVLVGHVSGGEMLRQHFGVLVPCGKLGVRVFFEISGFLITSLLVKEHERFGSISLKLFYVRRSLRIFPLAYTYILIIGGLAFLGFLNLPKHDFLWAATYAVAYHPSVSWFYGHLWSLSLEEQFYLVWPALLVILGLRGSRLTAAAIIVAAPFLRFLLWLAFPAQRASLFEWIPSTGDAIAFGSLLALSQEHIKERFNLRFGTLVMICLSVAVTVVACLPINSFEPAIRKLIRGSQDSLIHLLLAALLIIAVQSSGSIGFRILNSAVLRKIGTLSYAMYLCQQPFFAFNGPKSAATLLLGGVALLLVTFAAHHIVEKPLLRVRDRFKRVPAAAAGASGS